MCAVNGGLFQTSSTHSISVRNSAHISINCDQLKNTLKSLKGETCGCDRSLPVLENGLGEMNQAKAVINWGDCFLQHTCILMFFACVYLLFFFAHRQSMSREVTSLRDRASQLDAELEVAKRHLTNERYERLVRSES